MKYLHRTRGAIERSPSSRGGADAGSTITYTVTYGNDGASGAGVASNTVLVDNYDQTQLTNIVLNDPVNCSDNGDRITCNYGDLAYGTTGQVMSYTADIIVERGVLHEGVNLLLKPYSRDDLGKKVKEILSG